jgi:chromosome partitioning protein
MTQSPRTRGERRVAVCARSSVYYPHVDHSGFTSLTARTSGSRQAGQHSWEQGNRSDQRLNRKADMTRFVAIGNQKGGVGKTTTCLSLGACLAEMGKRVMLMDLDPQVNLTMSLGLKPETLSRTVSDVLLGDGALVSVSRETEVAGLDIAPGSTGLAVTEKMLYRSRGYEHLLKQAASSLDGKRYDYVLMDCPPSFGSLTLNALTVADLMIIPTQAEYYALRSLEHVFQLIKVVWQRTNPRLRYRILVTMYDRRNGVCVRLLGQMRGAFPDVLFQNIIEVDTKLRESPMEGKPITLYKPNTRGARQYRALAGELVDSDESDPGTPGVEE